MTINGSGTITGLSAGGLPDATIQQADLATDVAGTGPAFSAVWTGAAQSISSSTFAKAQVSSELFDTNSNYDNTTYRFTPTVAGYYQLNATVAFNSSSGGATRIIASFYKNGSEFLRGNYMQPYNSSSGCATVSGLIYLNGSTDYVELYGYMTATSPQIGGNANETSFNGFLARAA